MHVVINHLRLRDPVADTTVEAARAGMRLVVDAGAIAARVAKVDGRHLILILEFAGAEDADRIAREVGGPWMREHIRPLLAGDTERSVGKVIASAEA
jgi:acetyl-CoA carboxylase alpha subunit